MAVHEKFSGAIGALRYSIDDPHGPAAQSPERAADNCAREIRAYAEKPERVSAEIEAMVRSVSSFARTFARHWQFVQAEEQSRQAIEAERVRTYQAINLLEAELDGVELNGRGKAVL